MKTKLIITLSLTLLLLGCGGGGSSSSENQSATNTAPTLTLSGASEIQITVGDTFSDPGVSAYDTQDGNITASIQTNSTLDTSTIGNYIITYSVTDSNGNEVTLVRHISVVAQNQENYVVSWENNFTIPSQDANGWSILTPSADSHILYVANDGNDTTAIIYDANDSNLGSDVFHPTGTIYPYATIEAAEEQMRTGYPDYMLLKRGDSWEPTTSIWLTYGRSANERAVVGAYGDVNDERPLILNAGFVLNKSGYLALLDIHANADERNPDSTNFLGFDNIGNPNGIGGTLYNAYGGFLIEGCWFEWFGGNSMQTYSFDGEGDPIPVPDIIIRRNIINNNYSTAAHSQGLFSSWTSMLLEENIFDHNGWYKQGKDNNKSEGQATMFNHNTYFPESRNTIFRNNIFLRPSSIGNKFTSNTTVDENIPNQIRAWNILVDNNLYVEGEIGISLGGNKDQDDGPRWKDIYVTNNVLQHLGRMHHTQRDLGWGLGINDWQGGLVKGNIFSSWGEDGALNNYAIDVIGDTSNVDITDNIVYNLISSGTLIRFDGYDTITSFRFFNNELYGVDDPYSLRPGRLLSYSVNAGIGNLYDNYLYSEVSDQTKWFSGQGENYMSLEDYRTYTNDTTSLAQTRNYVDANRTIETYLDSLGYNTDMESFVVELKKQSKSNWRSAFTSPIINNYIRSGFEVK
ncbi:DUF5011 domain-containing protein [Sulfurimonas sp.]|uniref:DUF5011 domain-containing protein n=4 Tax=Sulfurimonas sp. TaxID=2022749 RepID=UPI003D12EAC4